MDTDEMIIWAAGLMSGMGGFLLIKNNGTHTVRFVTSTYVNKEAMLKLADVMNTNVQEVPMKVKRVKQGGEPEIKISYKISVSGKPLHRAMLKMWPYLTTERKREYKKLRNELLEKDAA